MHVSSLLNGSFHLQVFVEALKKGIFFKESSDLEQARLFNLGEVFLWAKFHISQLSACDLFQLSSGLLNDWMVCKLLWCFQVITFDDCHGQQWLCAILWKFLINACCSTSIILTMKHSIISVLWMKLKLGHCLQLIKPNSSLLSYRSCSPTGQGTTNSVNTLLWWAPTPPDGVKVNLRWQPWNAWNS